MTTTIRCIGLAIGLVDTREARQVHRAEASLQQQLRTLIEQRGGVFVEQSGTLSALFREVGAALETAVAMFERIDALDQSGPAPSGFVARIAVDSGEIELDGKRLHGALRDQLAALLVRTPNLSITIGAAAAPLLDPAWSSRTRPLSVEASEDAAGIAPGAVEMPWRLDATTHQEATVLAEAMEAAGTALFSSIELVVAGVSRRLQASDCPCTIGRDTRCDVVLSAGEASRLHATIEYDHNRFYYVDNSRNGSYVLTSAGEELFVHRERLWLVGRGAISPGAPVMQQSGELVRYICEPYRRDTTGVPREPQDRREPGGDAGTTLRILPR